MSHATQNIERPKKPMFYWYILLCSIIILFFIILLLFMYNKQAIILKDTKFFIKLQSLFSRGKVNCDTTKSYCFEDSDCNNACMGSNYACLHGMCKKNLNIIDATNNCDTKMGVIGYYIGNAALGIYEFICKSVDPGIAINTTENRMCYGDSSYQINYLDKYPSINTCDCVGKIIVPATSVKREHAECAPQYIGLV